MGTVRELVNTSMYLTFGLKMGLSKKPDSQPGVGESFKMGIIPPVPSGEAAIFPGDWELGKPYHRFQAELFCSLSEVR